MNIEITKRDIKNGRPCHLGHCPIALAIRRQTKASYVFVGSQTIDVDGEVFVHTKRSRAFVNDFDNCKYVEPFSFRLRRKRSH